MRPSSIAMTDADRCPSLHEGCPCLLIPGHDGDHYRTYHVRDDLAAMNRLEIWLMTHPLTNYISAEVDGVLVAVEARHVAPNELARAESLSGLGARIAPTGGAHA